jgi:hypothetical protein
VRRGRLALVAVLAAGAAGGVAAAIGFGSSTPPAAPSGSASARVQARSLLGRLRLPAGATRSAVEPHGDGGLLDPCCDDVQDGRVVILPINRYPGTAPYDRSSLVAAREWWTVRASPQSVFAFVKRFRPRGATSAHFFGYGPQSPSFSGTAQLATVEAVFQWPAVTNHFGGRQLIVAVAPLADRQTGVLAYAAVSFISPRGDSEQIPPGARELSVSTRLNRVNSASPIDLRPVVITSASRIRKVAALLNRLPLAPPAGSFGCQMGLDLVTVQLTFRSRRRGPPLASVQLDYGLSGLSGPQVSPCAVNLAINGDDHETGLLAGWARYFDLSPFPPLVPRLAALLPGSVPTVAPIPTAAQDGG